MAEYLAPGVYVEEVPSAVKTIAGVGTSTAGFVGIVPDGLKSAPLAPAKVPKRVTGWEQFKRDFGDFNANNKTLAHAVYGFFNNGGTACWVTRITDAADYQTGLDSFKSVDEIAIVALPGVTDVAVQTALLDHCVNMQDRFAIIDGQLPEDATGYMPDEISGNLPKSEDGYGAIYFPWIEVFDPVTKANDFVAPSGHIAGVYARTDAERGVHKVPANEAIRGALGIQHRLSRADQAALNPVGVNVIRAFNGSITVWGGRTWSNDAAFRYISTRRLMNYLRESIEDGTRWVVFEPNDMSLWQKIRRNTTAFLTNVWRDGALLGETPSQAFFVKCDEEINPPEVRDLGQVVTEIGVAIVKPAEFVIFRISQQAGQS